jgi:hypothetical protein
MLKQRNRAIAAAIAVASLTLGTSRPAAQAKPDFSGRWQVDLEASKALTERKGLEWRMAGGGSVGGGGGAAQGSERPVTIITQSETEIVVERRFEGDVIDRDVHKLVGSLSVNADRRSATRSTTLWKGTSLVTSGTMEMDMTSVRATTADGRPITEIKREFVTTRTLMPDGTMQIETRSTQNGRERVSWTVYVRVKAS